MRTYCHLFIRMRPLASGLLVTSHYHCNTGVCRATALDVHAWSCWPVLQCSPCAFVSDSTRLIPCLSLSGYRWFLCPVLPVDKEILTSEGKSKVRKSLLTFSKAMLGDERTFCPLTLRGKGGQRYQTCRYFFYDCQVGKPSHRPGNSNMLTM